MTFEVSGKLYNETIIVEKNERVKMYVLKTPSNFFNVVITQSFYLGIENIVEYIDHVDNDNIKRICQKMIKKYRQ